MTSFAFRAVEPDGRVVRGAEEAASSGELEQRLGRRGLLLIEATPTAGNGAENNQVRHRWWVGRHADVTDFVGTLSALLQAGLSLDRSMEVAGRGVARADLAEAVERTRRTVREGGRVADGLSAYPRLFPGIAVGLIRAGESGGHLAEAATRLAQYLERERALRSRITSAMIYPTLMLLAGIGAMGALLGFVLPRFVALLADTGSALPKSTAFLLALSADFTRTAPLLGIALVVGIVAFIAWRSTPDGRERIDAMGLRIPLLGPLRARHATARIARTLSTLLSGGLPLLAALEIAQATIGNTAIAADLGDARDAVRRGDSFSRALARGRGFPFAVIRLVEVGEETGELDGLLDRAATLLEGELERRIERMVALVEPVMIVVFGLVIGFVALALLQAIYGIQTQGV
ncbi:MAG TPA: type II secretion system F family protein [Longimicrobiaceae bacterium]|nr:type II secretion system F family protein [Longimicrobiaceae bacterium]